MMAKPALIDVSKHNLKVLVIDASSGFYRLERYPLGAFFGPVDLGLHMAGKHNSLNFGVGLLAGSIFPGSNRMIFTGFSPAWGGFYISSMGGAGLVFDDLGINMVSIIGKAANPSVLVLNRNHGEEIELELHAVNEELIWQEDGVYSLMQYVYNDFAKLYVNNPRILAVGPAAKYSDIGGIVSVPIKDGKLSHVDTWAGRGGLGSKLFTQHGICAIIYGGTHLDEDFRDRKVADEWFQARYEQKMVAKDLESTKKYRFDPEVETGGTFGVNYAKNADDFLAFNYRSIHWTSTQRKAFHELHIRNHYLKQFNEESIATKSFHTCGEPCVAVCKKTHGIFKKDYEPYQTLGPLCGIFDQRAAEMLCHKADSLGFDAISCGGFLAWLMDELDKGEISMQELGVNSLPAWDPDAFDTVKGSLHNASLACALLDNCIGKAAKINLREGARKYARRLSRSKGKPIINSFVYNAFGRRGWMVPNQYWTPGVLSPIPAMGRYYMYYGNQYFPPRYLGKVNAERMKTELMLDNLGVCRFHRAWAEEMLPQIIDELFGLREELELNTHITARRINCRNASVYWESERNIDFVLESLLRQSKNCDDPDLMAWIVRFTEDKQSAAFDYWYEIRKGIDESLKEI
ncbi:MAG: aldehyde ferredoxin oxidoreductase N-terminal domain-containing protein [Candidatus Cloacimonetes bacterium]|nr:aldehyde ferredoxin oxidoreductase N-terminal domain-containing protein [Candidatus Cloacimonadota bacterium]